MEDQIVTPWLSSSQGSTRSLAHSYTTGTLCELCVGLSLHQFYSNRVCRATLRGDKIPPGVANEIRAATPANGAGPITANDYDIDLPLSFGWPFEGGFYHWRIFLPFLPWADEVVAAGNLPAKATIPLFEIEDLVLSFVVWETAAEKLVDTTFKVGYVKRVLAHLLSRHFAAAAWTEPFSSVSTFLEQVHSFVRSLPEDSRAFLKVPRNAIQSLAVRTVDYTSSLEWLGHVTWASFKDDKNTCADARRFLRLLGYRATVGSRQENTGRACVMATQIGAGFQTVFPAFTFPAVILASQIVAWFICLKWPKALDVPMYTLDRVLTEYMRMHRYAMGTVAQQSVLLSEVFNRVLRKCKVLQPLLSTAYRVGLKQRFGTWL